MKFNLEKEVAKVKFVLEKKQMPNVRASVVEVLDVSGSAQGLFNSGAMQKAFQTVLPVAINFDDNGEIDCYTFAAGDHYVSHIEPNATDKNFEDYLQKNVIDNPRVPKWGGTDYAPVMEHILEDFGFYKKAGFFGGKKLQSTSTSGDPVIVFFNTDGANGDQGATRRLFRDMQEAGVQLYTLFIGIGPKHSFSNIVSLGDEFGNVGFLNVTDLEKTAEREDIYDLLLPEELLNWLKVTK